MRLAILLPDLHGGGAERAMIELARALRREGDAVDFVLMRDAGDLRGEAAGLGEVAVLGADKIRHVVAPLRDWLGKTRPDAVIANIWPLTSMATVARLGATHRPRLILVDHNPLSLQYGGRGRWHRLALRASLAATYRLADARVAVSAGVAGDLATLSGIDRSHFEVIHNPVVAPAASTAATTDAAEKAWGCGAGRRLLSVGSFKPQKNQALLLEALARMPAAQRPVLMLLGEGERREALAAQAEALGIASFVRMPGFCDPAPFYRTADALALSSDYEGFGNVIVEALACGLPVVATDCPHGPREILGANCFGRLVPMGDAAALATALGSVLAAPIDSDRLRRRAANFAPAVAAKAYRRLFRPGQLPLCPRTNKGLPT
jgi:glycosyltransferase involved in cell wall biosynthesis